jgi:hypothetical protein
MKGERKSPRKENEIKGSINNILGMRKVHISVKRLTSKSIVL